jgi:hypothetical protein
MIPAAGSAGVVARPLPTRFRLLIMSAAAAMQMLYRYAPTRAALQGIHKTKVGCVG